MVRGQRHAPAALYPGKDPVPIVQEAGWAPGPVLTGAENLVPTGIRSPDRPVRNQSLYRLSYPALGQMLTYGIYVRPVFVCQLLEFKSIFYNPLKQLVK